MQRGHVPAKAAPIAIAAARSVLAPKVVANGINSLSGFNPEKLTFP
jgi:hypothetical protein